jgi:tRNA pseudouridine55 synthase
MNQSSQLSGFLVVDKPDGITSARVVDRVKKVLGVRKAGHTGTLDPFATGVMICCVNQATKLARFFLHGHKTYQAVLCLGIETDTQDITGTVLSTSEIQDSEVKEERIRRIFKRFEGETDQIPPIYSALKHKGTPLYDLARKGKPVQKPPRRIFISSLNILDISLPEIHFEVSCSAGTYIRTLCADIGTSLGCGGVLKALRRTESCGFTLEDAVALSEMESLTSSGEIQNRMISMADGLPGMPVHVADKGLMQKIRYGNPLSRKDVPPPEGLAEFIKIVDTENNLLAVLSSQKDTDKYKYCCVVNSE